MYSWKEILLLTVLLYGAIVLMGVLGEPISLLPELTIKGAH